MQLLLSGTTDVRMYVVESGRTFENILQIYSEKDTYWQRLQNLIHNKDKKGVYFILLRFMYHNIRLATKTFFCCINFNAAIGSLAMLLTDICQQLLIILSLMLKMSQLHLKRVARMQRCPKAEQNRK